MRITEGCACGATYEVVFGHPKQYPYTNESEVALEQLEAWRAYHSACRTFGPAVSAALRPQQAEAS